MAGISALVALILGSYWASKNDSAFLSVPNWKTNIFPWHPVLLIVSYFSQVLAIPSWQTPGLSSGGLFSLTKVLHIFWNTSALATLIVGLWAVFKYRADKKEAHLVTSHEWIGIATASLMALNYLIGASFTLWKVGIVKQSNGRAVTYFQAFQLQTIDNIKTMHKLLGLLLLLLSTANILSGIVQLQDSCVTKMSYSSKPSYPHLPEGCRVSNGIGIVIVFTTLVTFLAVASRYDILTRGVNDMSSEETNALHERINSSGELQTNYVLQDSWDADSSAGTGFGTGTCSGVAGVNAAPSISTGGVKRRLSEESKGPRFNGKDWDEYA